MKLNHTLRTLLVPFLFLVLMAGCASSTMINSIPSGADVFINGELAGKTPYLYKDTKVSFSPVYVDIAKEGYETLYTSFRRDEEFNAGTFIGGFIVWPIWLWTLEYKPARTYVLQPLVNDFTEDSVKDIHYIGTTKLDKLRELKTMLDEKLITEAEYEVQKKKILKEP